MWNCLNVFLIICEGRMSQWPTGRRASACIYLEWRVCNFVSNNFVPGNFNIVSMIQVFCSQYYFLDSRKFCSF